MDESSSNNKEKNSEDKTTSETDKLKLDLQESKNAYLRLQAEFANYKKRNATIFDDARVKGRKEVLIRLVDVYDDFELALKNSQISVEDFTKGVELIFAKTYSVGEEFGLKKFECVGKTFDPRKHEALLTEKSNKKENIILEELQPGYIIADEILRHAKVKVARK